MMVLFLFHSVGSSLVLVAWQGQVRREVKRRIKEGLAPEQLQVLTFSQEQAAALDWKEQGREFRYQGMFYDVVRVQEIGGQLQYQCITDTQERDLFAALDQLVQDHLSRSAKQKSLKLLVKNLAKVYQTSRIHYSLEFLTEAPPSEFHDQFPLSTTCQDIPVPPPKLG
ncbi:hypothetical protein GU926_17575 [Nibribacter ruber]|uniref:Uncharacterized protein n=1 Tax=Nibribacter ruber TaxID=2698458 RepID=A0A6P1P423_9BACT|nr:hypothetical protein [Nibribacter ruber]QHL89142.1 hypothetical protein GU926_17575 [Nibribacter ruber]